MTGQPALHYRLNVQQAVHLLCRTGDLRHQDRPVATAREGSEAHRQIQQSWPEDVAAEQGVKQTFTRDEFKLTLRGRLDGVADKTDALEIIEIKTLRHAPDLLPEGIQRRHQLQILLYARLWLMENPGGMDRRVRLTLVYFDISEQKSSASTEALTEQALIELTEPLLASLIDWFADLTLHRKQRNTFLSELSFPYPDFRLGQRELAEQVYRAIRDPAPLLLEAPTGSGKSLATLFPALKALAQGHIDQVVITTAKLANQEAAIAAVALLGIPRGKLRTLQLTAQDRVCQADSVCNLADCPRQTGFFERLPGALEDCLAEGFLGTEQLTAISLQQDLCPHGLQSMLIPWCDLVIGDYNYVFSPTVRNDFNFSINKTAILVDEAHNLPDRARDLFSASLRSRDYQQLQRQLNTPSSALAVASRKLAKEIRKQTVKSALEDSEPANVNRLQAALNKAVENFSACAESWLLKPHDLVSTVDVATVRTVETGLQQALQWLSICESAADDYACLTEVAEPQESLDLFTRHPRKRSEKSADKTVHLRCLSPARMLQPYLKASRTTVLFSATMTPPWYYQRLLGFPDNARKQRLRSPFSPNNLKLTVLPQINMRAAERSAQLPLLPALIASVYYAKPGNYWVFTPSFEYQKALAAQFAERHPDIEVISQVPGASRQDKDAFLQKFSSHSKSVGFTVLGGTFGESVDLPGDKLVGVIILGPGIPQMNRINECIAKYFSRQNLSGFDYAYKLPGWQKVVQAAGRVIRTEQDRGVVILADDRFLQPGYRELYPPHWQAETCSDMQFLESTIKQFWDNDEQTTST